MASGNHDRNSAARLIDHRVQNATTFIIGEREVFRVICENADGVRRAIDQIVDDATLSVQVEFFPVGKIVGATGITPLMISFMACSFSKLR